MNKNSRLFQISAALIVATGVAALATGCASGDVRNAAQLTDWDTRAAAAPAVAATTSDATTTDVAAEQPVNLGVASSGRSR